jgi:hypothetical protein
MRRLSCAPPQLRAKYKMQATQMRSTFGARPAQRRMVVNTTRARAATAVQCRAEISYVMVRWGELGVMVAPGPASCLCVAHWPCMLHVAMHHGMQ